MKKFFKLLVLCTCLMFLLIFTINVYAQEQELVVYDCLEQTEYKYSVNEKSCEALKELGESVESPYIPSNLQWTNDDIIPYTALDESIMTVVNPNVYPNTTVTHLKIGYDTTGDGKSDSWYIGSGYIVGPDVMVTAGH